MQSVKWQHKLAVRLGVSPASQVEEAASPRPLTPMSMRPSSTYRADTALQCQQGLDAPVGSQGPSRHFNRLWPGNRTDQHTVHPATSPAAVSVSVCPAPLARAQSLLPFRPLYGMGLAGASRPPTRSPRPWMRPASEEQPTPGRFAGSHPVPP